MASTTALFSGLSGLNANARHLDVIGNNISNINTTAFKSTRMVFASQFARTFGFGSPPSESSGGTNPGQVGLGVRVAGTQRNFTTGSINPTGDARDLAIEGKGFFVVQRGDQVLYTRAGSFRPNALNDLTTISGDRLMGYGVDEQFNIIPGDLNPINLPVGSLTLAEPSTTVRYSGNLNANGPLPTRGSLTNITGTASAGLVAIPTASPAPSLPNLVEGSTRLVDIEDPLLPGSGTPLFAVGQVLELNGAQKGGRTLATASLTITAATTITDLMNFIQQALGITTGIGNNPDGRTPGVALDPLTGTISITGNVGADNDLLIENGDLRLVSSSASFIRNPFASTKAASADGESAWTRVQVYDSLGTPLYLDLTVAIVGRDDTGTQWRYFAESPDDTDLSPIIGGGIVQFDTRGRLITDTPLSVSIDRTDTGAGTPLGIQLRFSSAQDNVTALADNASNLAATFRDGAPLGTLESYGFGADGTITGSFSNGLTRTLGQVALATFSNQEGLVDTGGGLFTTSPNSGTAVVTEPLQLGAGAVVGGALELSNVDLGQEFINMILAQTGYSAATRIIRTSDDLMQQLLSVGR